MKLFDPEKKLLREWLLEEFTEIGGSNLVCRWTKSNDYGKYFDLPLSINLPLTPDTTYDLLHRPQYQWKSNRLDGEYLPVLYGDEWDLSFRPILDKIGARSCHLQLREYTSAVKYVECNLDIYIPKSKLVALLREKKINLLIL